MKQTEDQDRTKILTVRYDLGEVVQIGPHTGMVKAITILFGGIVYTVQYWDEGELIEHSFFAEEIGG